MFARVLVANRGEIAVRVIRALRELGIEAVAVYSTADKDAAHVRLADRAVCIGPPSPTASYLNIPSVVAAANTTGCEAVHPGYGFLAERPAFVEACVDNDLVFIGPDAKVMARMGDKVEAKAAMRAAGVPLVPGTEEATTLDQARELAPGLGFPVLLKAAAGGGGRGMRLVTSADELEDAYATASGEAQAAFGERECSIQRRHQKLIEESPSAALTPERREEMEAAAERACLATGYTNAGTLELLLGPDDGFYFIELNARLQVEHPVSELVTGIDIVHEQLRVAAGESLRLTGRAPRQGHAIEVRINAEDPTNDFSPSPGRIERLRIPGGPGVRMDTHVEAGASIPPNYDSLIAKLCVWDEDRPAAIARALRALGELEVEGVATTRDFAMQVLGTEAFVSGDYNTSFIDEHGALT